MFIADLHIHSRFSRAPSREGNPSTLDLWARKKGIDVIGTGDFTHPAWREELSQMLTPAEEGLYVLKDEYRLKDLAAPQNGKTRFVVSGEISSIYKQDGKVRKVHNLILLPGLSEAALLSKKLEAIGNLHSDGRPILGLSSRDLLEATLEVCPRAIFIPAHIWTPHFSLFGAFSGFDTIGECFGDLTGHIHALETGLSSDPPMNWRVSALDRFALVSNSDAHSPQKLGREANVFDGAPSYPALEQALGGGEGLLGTIEFFPEEGKYHLDGHRGCGVRLSPGEAKELGGKCPVCGKKLTIGVYHRVEYLADRKEGYQKQGAAGFESLVPLPEILGSVFGVRTLTSPKVTGPYEALLKELGPEFFVLRQAPLEDISRIASPLAAEAVRRVRAGQVRLDAGFDGQYGTVEVFSQKERNDLLGQLCFFAEEAPAPKPQNAKKAVKQEKKPKQEKAPAPEQTLNEAQEEAVLAPESAVCVIAGPGTGKTKTLVSRMAHLLCGGAAKPAELTAVTFTNQAAAQLKDRLAAKLGAKGKLRGLTVGTFHAICLALLQKHGPVSVIDEFDALGYAQETIDELALGIKPAALLDGVSRRKNGLSASLSDEAFALYNQKLATAGVLDFDDLLLSALALLEDAKKPHRQFSHVLVDEFQDINPLQYRLLRAFCKNGKSVFAIGDPDQAIYGFRGSDEKCFGRFLADFSGAKVVTLTQNYRSTPQILHLAKNVIEKDAAKARRLLPNREDGPPVRLVTCPDEFSAAIFAAKEINRMVGGVDMLDTDMKSGGTRGFSDIALLYRTHRQARALEKCLQTEGIPYTVAGRDSLLADKAVRGTVGFFRCLLNPRDTASLKVCLQHALGCTREEAAALSAKWDETAPAGGGLERLGALYHEFLPRVQKEKPAKLLNDWVEACALAGDGLSRLLDFSAFSQDMPSFLENLTLGKESDLRRSQNGKYTPDGVRLLTLHAAKGLEFPVVFLCGVNKGIMPLTGPGKDTDFAEERRLFYVGLTRAEQELVMLTYGEASPFLQDAEKGAFRAETGYVKKAPPKAVQLCMDLDL